MADLQVCYFCGSGPDGTLGEYAVVPRALDPTDDLQRSVVLCPDCREKLTTLMEPVVEAAEAKAGAGGPDAEQAGSSRPAGATGAGDATGGGAATGGGDDAGGDSPAADEPAAGAGDEVEVTPPESDEADDDAAASTAGGAGAAPTGDESADTGGDDGTRGAAAGGAAAGATGGGAGSDDASGEDGPPPDSNAPRDQPHTDDELVGRNNEAYNKTLRLLQNREFPVERHEIEQVAANAYQLDPQEVSDAIDALIAKGLLTQEGAQLVRT